MTDSAFRKAWLIMKGIVWNGVEYEDIDELHPEILSFLENWDENNKTLPEPPFKASGRQGTPFRAMRDDRLAGIDPSRRISRMKGFTDPAKNMLTTFMNWEGGKTSEMPRFRRIADLLEGDYRPVEPMGGSASFLLGMNKNKGLYNDINPDLVNVMRQAQKGLGVVSIPQSQEALDEGFEAMNALRQRRDVDEEELNDEELNRLARHFVQNNLSSFRTDWKGKPWGDDSLHGEGEYPSQKWRTRSQEAEETGTSHKNWRAFPHDAGSYDLTPYANRMKGFEIHEGDMMDIQDSLTDKDLLYLDPPYMSRNISYGAGKKQQAGKTFDDFQRNVLRLGAEHKGPSPLKDYIKALQDAEYQIHPWLRKPKANKFPQVEMIGLKGFNKPPSQKSLFDY